MKKIPQRQIFLEGEGDAWFQRNRQSENKVLKAATQYDPLADLINNLPLPHSEKVSVLEVGCGEGLRLGRLKKSYGWSVSGLDPSAQAIRSVHSKGLPGTVGTADFLPIGDATIDLLIFGFCLYLCDRADLFKIAAEADRVLKPQAWLSILDFWSPDEKVNNYHHLDGVNSYKSDLPAMFSWHPFYLVTDHQIRHHQNRSYTDDSHQWVAATMLRKLDPSFWRE